MAPSQLAKLWKELQDRLDSSYIHPLKAPFGASALFQKDGSLRMCITIEHLTRSLSRTSTPSPLRAELFDNWGILNTFSN